MANPKLSLVIPAPDTEEVAESSAISFRITADNPLDLTSTFVYIRSKKVYHGPTDTFTSGWTSSSKVANTGNGYDFVFIPDESLQWGKGEIILVEVDTADTAGFSESVSWTFKGAGEALSLSAYPMLAHSLRQRDEQESSILKGLYRNDPDREGGYDFEWKTKIFDRASELWDLLDPKTCPDKWLSWLSTQVGFTRDMVFAATPDELRVVIQYAMLMWSHKPSELGYLDAVRMTTGNRFRIRNYFDLRLQSDWTSITELLEDQDPNVLDFPSTNLPYGSDLNFHATTPTDGKFTISDLPESVFLSSLYRSKNQFLWLEVITYPADSTLVGFYEIKEMEPGTKEAYLKNVSPFSGKTLSTSDKASWRLWGGQSDFLTEIRVVDEVGYANEINRTLLGYLLNLVRPSSERIDLVFVSFLDEFQTFGNLDQWDHNVAITEEGGYAEIPLGGYMEAATSNAPSWSEVCVAFKIQGETSGPDPVLELHFQHADGNNTNKVVVDYGAQTLQVVSVTGGISTALASAFIPTLLRGFPDVIRITTVSTGSGGADNLYRIDFNGDRVIEIIESSAPNFQGTVYVAGISGTCRLYLVEVMELPVTVQRIGPNP